MNLTLNKYKTAFVVFSMLLIVALCFIPDLAFAKDYIQPAKKDMQDTFGPNSTAWWIVMVAEVLASAILYIRTRNFAVFGGVVALMIFANVAFGLF